MLFASLVVGLMFTQKVRFHSYFSCFDETNISIVEYSLFVCCWIDVHTACAFSLTVFTCLMMKLTFELLNGSCCWLDVYTVGAFSFKFFTCLMMKLTFDLLNVVCLFHLLLD